MMGNCAAAMDREICRWFKSSAGEYIQNIENTEYSARGDAVVEEICSPYMSGKFCQSVIGVRP